MQSKIQIDQALPQRRRPRPQETGSPGRTRISSVILMQVTRFADNRCLQTFPAS